MTIINNYDLRKKS